MSTGADASSATGDGSIQTSTALVHYLGRFDTTDAAGPKFSWPGSAITATFTGTGITAQLVDAGTNYFTVVIDGGTPTVVPTSSQAQTYTLASGLAAGQHTIVLTKRTESLVGVVQFLGFQPQGGALVASPEPFTRRIELVGDSITCGYGDLGIGPNCGWSPATEDETIAYGALAASQLNAEATVIAYSGIGVYENANGLTTDQMPVLFERTLADDPTSQWGFTTPDPDVVVINLGTNDFANGDPGQAYQTAYVAFLRQVRGHYANAYIICTSSPMLGSPSHASEAAYIQTAISQVGDPRVSFLDLVTQDQANGLGCDWHPSPKTHQLMATTLVSQISSLTGW
jgi:lysophospholipase L1-like esterase